MASTDEWEPMAQRATRLGVGVGALYAVLGLTWVLLSDVTLAANVSNAGWLTTLQSVKGLLYIAVTAVGLAVIVRQGHLRLMREEAKGKSHELQTLDLYTHHPQPMWVFDRTTLAILSVNGAAITSYGYTQSEFLGLMLRDINPSYFKERLDGLSSMPLTGYRDVGTVQHVKASGEVIHVHVTVHPVQFDGRIATMAMAIDVTQEVLAARAVARQEEQFRQLHQSLGEVLWLSKFDGRKFVYVSSAFEYVYGRPCSALEANPQLWIDVVIAEDKPVAAASNDRLRSLGHSNCEYRIQRPDGSVRWISDRKSIIGDSEGLVTLVGGIAEDITELKEREAERATAEAKLERMVAERTSELATVNAELDAFTRTAAHDLKAPLNGIAGFCQILRKKHGPALGEDGLRTLGRVEHSAHNMASLVNDLLMLSRVAARDLDVQEVDFAKVAKGIIDELQEREPHRQVTFKAPSELLVRFDPGLANLMLTNLLGNAWKFTGKRLTGNIHLSAWGTDEDVTVYIEDNGAGFDSAIAPAVFKPFQRFHSLSEFTGTGVGLVTCQRILQRHGGELQIASSPGNGATVKLTIPRSPAPAEFMLTATPSK